MISKNMKTEKKLKKGKRRKRAILAALISVVVMAAGITAIVFATGVKNVKGVYQGNDKYSFLSPAPNGTIDIDLDMLGDRSIMSQAAMKPQLTKYATDNGFIVERGAVSSGESQNWYVLVNGYKTPNGELSHTDTNTFTGELFSFTYKNAATLPDGSKANVKLTYSDAEIELFNLNSATNDKSGIDPSDDRYSFKYKVFLASGTRLYAACKDNPEIKPKDPNEYYYLADTSNYYKYGFKIKTKIQIVDDRGNAIDSVTIDGKEVPATFYYPMVDIDVIRNSNSWDYLHNSTTVYNNENIYQSTGINRSFSEQYRIETAESGIIKDDSGNYVYVPGPEEVQTNDSQNNVILPDMTENYALSVFQDSAGLRFYHGETDRKDGSTRPGRYGQGDKDPGTYRTGFVSPVDNSKGLTLTGWFSGGKETDNALQSFVCSSGNSPITWHKIKSSSTLGGTIQTTEYGNENGNLKDSGKVLQPGTYLIPEHRDHTIYTMTPDKGYEASEFYVSYTTEGGTKHKRELTSEEMKKLKKEGTLTINEWRYSSKAKENNNGGKHNEGNGYTYSYDYDAKPGTLSYDSGTGVLKFDFPDNTYDHEIHVGWRQIPEVVNATKYWDDFDNNYSTRQNVIFHIDIKSVSKSGGMTVTHSMQDVLPPQRLTKGDTVADLIKTWGNVKGYTAADNTPIERVEDLPEKDDLGNDLLWESKYTDNGLRYVGTSTYKEVEGYKNDSTGELTTYLPKYAPDNITLVQYKWSGDKVTAYTDPEDDSTAVPGMTYTYMSSGIYQHSSGAVTEGPLPTVTKPGKNSVPHDNLVDKKDGKIHVLTTDKEHVVNVLARYDEDGGEIEYIIRETLDDGNYTDVAADDPSKGLVGYLTDVTRDKDTMTKVKIGDDDLNAQTQNYNVDNVLETISEDKNTEVKVKKHWLDQLTVGKDYTTHTEKEIADSFKLYRNSEEITNDVWDFSQNKSKIHGAGILLTDNNNVVQYRRTDIYERTTKLSDGTEESGSLTVTLPVFRSADGSMLYYRKSGSDYVDENGNDVTLPEDAVRIAYNINDDGEYFYSYEKTDGTAVTIKFKKYDGWIKENDPNKGELKKTKPSGFHDGQKYVVIKNNNDGTWTYTVEGLPAYVSMVDSVVPAVYFVKEDDDFVSGGKYMEPSYTNQDKAFDENTITNTERIIVKAKKNWEDDDDSLRKDIALHIDATMKIKNGSSTLSADIKDVLPAYIINKMTNDLTAEWGNTNKYENPGDEIIYAPSELPKDEKGNNITYVPEVGSDGLRYAGYVTYTKLEGFVCTNAPDQSIVGNAYESIPDKDPATETKTINGKPSVSGNIYTANYGEDVYEFEKKEVYRYTGDKQSGSTGIVEDLPQKTKPDNKNTPSSPTEYDIDWEDDGTTYTGTVDHKFIVNKLPRYDAAGNEIVYNIRETLADGTTDVEADDPESGLKGYTTEIDPWKDFEESTSGETVVKSGNVTNTKYFIGLVDLKVDKTLKGRGYKNGDDFIFALTAKDGTPMPIEADQEGDRVPTEVIKHLSVSEGNMKAGTVRGTVDFGKIAFTRADMKKKTIKYGDASGSNSTATQAEIDSVRYWTANVETNEQKKNDNGDLLYLDGDGNETTEADDGNGTRYAPVMVTEEKTFDMKKQKDKIAFKALPDAKKNAAEGTVMSNTFTYKITENPQDSDNGDSKPIKNDKDVEQITVNVLYDQINIKMFVSAKDKNGEFVTGQDATVKDIEQEPKVHLEKVFFENEYEAEGTYKPEATKILDGGALKQDQFTFRFKAIDTPEIDPQTKQPVTYSDNGSGQKELIDVKTDDTPMPGKDANNKPNKGNGTAGKGASVTNDLKEYGFFGGLTNETGTDRLAGPVSFDDITYTSDDLKKFVTWNAPEIEQSRKGMHQASDDEKKLVRKWRWTVKDSNNNEVKYVYGSIPDDARAKVTVDGKQETVTHKNATDAQRKAAMGDTLETKWEFEGERYIAPSAYSVPGEATADFSGNTVKYKDATAEQKADKSKEWTLNGNSYRIDNEYLIGGHLSGDSVTEKPYGYYYLTERAFTYELTEDIPGAATAKIGSKDWPYSDALAELQETTPEITKADIESAKWKLNGITYDAKVYIVGIKVTDNKDGTVSAEPYTIKVTGTGVGRTIEKDSDIDEADDLLFRNEYEPQGKVQVGFEKVWDDSNDALKARKDAVIHLDASYEENGHKVTVKDIRPPQTVDKNATGNNIKGTWGTDRYLKANKYGDFYGKGSIAGSLPSNPAYLKDHSLIKKETDYGTYYIYKDKNTGEVDQTWLYDALYSKTKDDSDITYSVREDEIPGYSTKITEGNWSTTDPKTKTFTVTNKIVSGTVNLYATKSMDGRSFADGDKFSFMISGKDGAPMPVKYENNEFTADEVTKDATLTTGTVKGRADLGMIAYTVNDLEKTIIYKDATDESKIKFVTGDWYKDEAGSDYEKIVYVSSIPDDAMAAIPNAANPTADPTVVKYKDANDAQKTAAKGEVAADSLWRSKDGKIKYTTADIPDDAVNTIYENTFTYKIMENPQSKDNKDHESIENDKSVKEIKVYVLWDPSKEKIYASAAKNSKNEYVTGASDITVAPGSYSSGMKGVKDLEDVYFTNKYTSKGTWTPDALKILKGRPLERDDFKFKIRAADTKNGSDVVVRKEDTPMPGKTKGGTKDAKGQDVKVAGEGEAKGANNVNGPVSFGEIEYTHEDLAQKVVYDAEPSDDQKTQYPGIRKAESAEQMQSVTWEWTEGSGSAAKTYVYGLIPDDAQAKVTVNGDTKTISFGEATDAQRKAAEGTTKDTKWKKGNKYYIGIKYDNTGKINNNDLIADGAVGTVYLKEKTFTYEIYEDVPDDAKAKINGTEYTYAQAKDDSSISDAMIGDVKWKKNGNLYDASIKSVTVKVTDNYDGTITAVSTYDPNKKFENEYKAAGDVKVIATKDIEGKEFDGTNKFTFTLQPKTPGAPKPEEANPSTGIKTVEITPTTGSTFDFDFGDIKFTHEDLMSAGGTGTKTDYDAVRTKDGYYQKTFLYELKETAVTGKGVNKDPKTITVAITVQEDKEGNITVVSINSDEDLKVADLNTLKTKELGFTVDREKADTSSDPKKDAHSTVKAGVFTNEYNASGSVTIKATKKLETAASDKTVLDENQFYFELLGKKLTEVQNAADADVTIGTGTNTKYYKVTYEKVLDTKPNAAPVADNKKGLITFDDLTYSFDQVKEDAEKGIADHTPRTGLDPEKWTYTYKVKEIVPDPAGRASGITYDTSEKTVVVVVTDNGDGTLDVNKYLGSESDANLIPDTDAGNEKILFTNKLETVNIPVQKVWVHTPVEDVTLRLERALIDPYKNNGDAKTEAEIKTEAEGLDNSSWKTDGRRLVIKRNEFGQNGGTVIIGEDPAGQSGSEYKGFLEGFNKNVPIYVTKDGNFMRAVYRITEDNTSSEYNRSYSTDGKTEQRIYATADSATPLTVKNTTVAKGVGDVAAVKQLVGREWTDSDEYKFILEPLGKAEYKEVEEQATGVKSNIIKLDEYGNVEYVKKNGQTEIDKAIPMPSATDQQVIYNGTPAEKSAKRNTTIVGEGERLADFQNIHFRAKDLTYDEIDGHMQGDFYYTMKENIPDNAVLYDRAKGKPVNKSGTVVPVADAIKYGDIKNTYTAEDLKGTDWKVIDESDDGFNGMVYDGTIHTVHIKVRGTRNENLMVQTIYDQTNQAADKTGTPYTPVYTNHYESKGTIDGVFAKDIVGRAPDGNGNVWKNNDEFTFKLQSFNGDDAPMPLNVNGNVVKETIINNSSGTVPGNNARKIGSFGTIHFDESHLYDVYKTGGKAGTRYGIYYYALHESDIKPADTDLAKDDSRFFVKVTVEDAGNGKLTTKAEYYRSAADLAEGKNAGVISDTNPIVFENVMAVDIKFFKYWDDKNNVDKLRPSINLFKDNIKLFAGKQADGLDAKDVTAKYATNLKLATVGLTDYTFTWKDLPKYEDKQLVYYFIRESIISNDDNKYYKAYDSSTLSQPIPADKSEYTGKTTLENTSNVNVVFENDSDKTGEAAITNLHTPDMVDITARKIWNDKVWVNGTLQNAPVRPDTVKLTLQQYVSSTDHSKAGAGTNGVWIDHQTQKVSKDNADFKSTSGLAETWLYTFRDLPRTDSDNKVYRYRVVENDVPNGYVRTYFDGNTDPTDNDPNVIVNTYQITSIKGKKVWKDTDNTVTHDTSEEVKLNVFWKTEYAPSDDTTVVQGKTYYSRSGDTYTAVTPQTGDNPKEKDWFVEEDNTGEVTNPHIDWNGNDYTVAGLPKYDKYGVRYTYWTVEKPIPGYKTAYNNNNNTRLDESTDAANKIDTQKAATDKGYNDTIITNTFDGKAKLSGTKTWVGGSADKHVNASGDADYNGVTDDKLGIKLYRNGIRVTNVKVNGEDKVLVVKWDGNKGDSTFRFGYIDNGTFKEYDFDIYDEANNKAYVYTVDEDAKGKNDKPNPTGAPLGYAGAVKDFDITNTYSADPVKITPIITKKVADMPEEVKDDVKKFTFILAAKDGTSGKDQQMPAPAETSKQTVTLKADKTKAQFDFGELTFTKTGTYKYDLYEQAEDGWISDNPVMTITINVTDNDEGKLVAKVAGAKDPDFSEVKPEIKNTYDKDAKAVVPDIDITKELTGHTRQLNKDEFKFTLTGQPAGGSYKNASGKTAAGTNSKASSNDSTFDTIELSGVTFTKEDSLGTYLFILEETEESLPGITYDKTEYKVEAKVTDKDTNGDIEVEWKVVSKKAAGSSTWTDVPESAKKAVKFSNVYNKSSIDATPVVKKQLTVPAGSDRKLLAEEFEFKLIGLNGAQEEKNLTGKNVAGEAKEQGQAAEVYNNVAWGTSDAEKLIFTFDDLKKKDGTFDTERKFKYTVFEKAGEDDKMSYDGAVYTGTLRVYIGTEGEDKGKLLSEWIKWEKDGSDVTAAVKGTAGNPLKFDNDYVPNAVSSDLAAKKVLKNPNGGSSTRTLKADEFMFRLAGTSNNAKDMKAVALNDDEGQIKFTGIKFTKTGTYVFKLAEIKGQDQAVTYDNTQFTATATVSEVKDNNDKTTGDLKVEWSIKKGEDSVQGTPEFINKIKPDTISIPVRKVWDDSNNQDDLRGNVVVAIRQASGSQGKWDGKDMDGNVLVDSGEPTDKGKLTLTENNNYKDKFDKLPAYDEDGGEISYSVDELTIAGEKPDDRGYKVEYALNSSSGLVYENTPVASKGEDINIRNTHNFEKISVSVEKRWMGDGEVKKDTRKDVTFFLIGRYTDSKGKIKVAYDGGEKKIMINSGNPAHITVGDDVPAGEITWNDLPRYFNGHELKWTVYENNVPGYVVSGGDKQKEVRDGTGKLIGYKFVIRNKYVGSVRSVTAKKIWEDDNNAASKRSQIYFRLYRQIGPDGKEESVGDPVKVATGSPDFMTDTEYTWNNLPETLTGKGKDTYDDVDASSGTVNPKDNNWYEKIGENYEPTDDVTVESGKTYYKSSGGEYTAVDDSELYNGDNPKNKGWYEKNGNDYEKTDDKTVQSGKTYYEKKDNETELPVYYSVKEVHKNGDDDWVVGAPDDYDVLIYSTKPGKFEVRNIIKDRGSVHVNVKKIWNDFNDKDGLRPSHIVLRLMKGDGKGVEVTKAVVEENNDEWIHSFGHLPKFDNDGKKIKYWIKEDDIEGYTMTGGDEPIDTDADGNSTFNITNTHDVEAMYDLVAVKNWSGDSADTSTRKDVKFHLIKVVDGNRTEIKDVKTIKANATGNDLKVTWKDLPVIEGGKRINYTVREDDIEGYTTSVSDTKITKEPKKKGAVTPNEYENGEFTVTVTNKYSARIIVNPGGDDGKRKVTYLDPIAKSGKMILSTSLYDSQTEADIAAKNADNPKNPKHKGMKFIGWDVNQDEYGDYIVVAMYSDTTKTDKFIVSYVDGKSKNGVLKSLKTDKASKVTSPNNPKHNGLIFDGWKKTKDADGNIIYVAKYKPYCTTSSGANKIKPNWDPDKPGKQKVRKLHVPGSGGNSAGTARTGDSFNVTWWIAIMAAALVLLLIAAFARRKKKQ